ncbi:MAG TPA: hypothetical protein VJ901_05815 [Thermoanaerobaculia bacterium]|nr:hypothetical protein [Thermoanaerobaculia bacterium]
MSTIRQALGVAHGEHPAFEQLEQVVDGTADDVTREIVESHCQVCAQCAGELRDLREFAEGTSRSMWPRMLAAAAAVAAVVLIPAWIVLREPPKPVPLPHPAPKVAEGYGRADWDAAVRDALQRGTVELPQQHWPKPDPQRGPVVVVIPSVAEGPGGTGGTTARAMTPVNVVIETTTPILSWPAIPARYVVSVYDGPTRVAQSELLKKPEWQVTPPLARGRTYAWQVKVHRGASVEQLPAPPAPPAMFQVLDTDSATSLADARSRFPNDRLLRGVLEARFGLQKEAADDLRAYAVQHPENKKAAALAESVQ